MTNVYPKKGWFVKKPSRPKNVNPIAHRSPSTGEPYGGNKTFPSHEYPVKDYGFLAHPAVAGHAYLYTDVAKRHFTKQDRPIHAEVSENDKGLYVKFILWGEPIEACPQDRLVDIEKRRKAREQREKRNEQDTRNSLIKRILGENPTAKDLLLWWGLENRHGAVKKPKAGWNEEQIHDYIERYRKHII